MASGNKGSHYDVIVVGAGIAGCTAALMYARRGLSVALVEKQSSVDAHKTLCTHYLQPGAVPVLRELGLYRPVMDAGGVHSSMHIRSPWGPFTVPHPGRDRGINIRRSFLDPLLRRSALAENGIHLFSGARVNGVRRRDERIVGIDLCDSEGVTRELDAPLTVAADGRGSSLARLAGITAAQTTNERFSFFAYYRGLPDYPENNVQVWLAERGRAYVAAFPNGDLTLVSCYVPLARYEQWRGNVEAQYLDFVSRQPDGPDLTSGERVSEILGMHRMPSLLRPRHAPGLALVGDAAMAVDPLAGVGCTWAFQSARMLVRSTAPALAGAASEQSVDHGLARYRRRHKIWFGPQYYAITRFSRAKPYSPVTRGVLRLLGLIFRAKGAVSKHASTTARHA